MDAVIAKYDLDGDPIHDEQERHNATADLQAFQVIKVFQFFFDNFIQQLAG